ncbi:unnamed protein product [Cyclocybe aegerita]|uniref:Uncharacterized protein n=1 Tax=Cyclocybe aegerita TaxID=1973307 RepID=A0A8S0VTH0_CYCAE|nr:unnamed protein product [Cyclocybe aegerita]
MSEALPSDEGQMPTCHSQQKSQQDAVDAPRIASDPSGNTFSAGIHSIFSGSIGPIVEAEMNRMKEKLRAAEVETSKCRNTLEGYQAELYRSQGEVHSYARKCREIQQEQQGLVQTNTNLVHELNAVNRRLEETKALGLRSGIRDTDSGRYWAGAQILLTEAHALPYTDLLDKVDAFNKEVAVASGFLRKHIIYRSQDAFQEEFDEAREEIEAVLGRSICALLVSQSRNAELGAATPPALFVQIITQLLLVAFSVSEISQRSALLDTGDGKSDLSSREHHQLQTSQPPSSWNKFRTSFLAKLSMVFKTAAWSIPGSEARAEFALRLKPLFVAKEDLGVAIRETFASDKIEPAIVDYGASFTPEIMQDGFPGSEGKAVAGELGVTDRDKGKTQLPSSRFDGSDIK